MSVFSLVASAKQPAGVLGIAAFSLCLISGCRSPEAWRQQADRQAERHIRRMQQEGGLPPRAVGVDSPADELRRRLLLEQNLPTLVPPGEPEAGGEATGATVDPPRLMLADALRIAARNSREYQTVKENVFRAALALDLREEEFRHSLSAALSGAWREQRGSDPPVRGLEGSATATARQTLSTGAALTARLAVDVVKLLTLDRDSAHGLLSDATVTLPLWRGASRAVVLEPLRQAERNLLYAICEFERFRRTLAVRIAEEYLGALQQEQLARHAEENERRIALATTRAEELGRAGRLSAVQVDQARQDLLRARERALAARMVAEQRRDRLKLALGLPPDARVELDERELERLASSEPAGASEADEAADAGDPPQMEEWLREALRERLDLRVARARVEDAERAVRVAADALRAGLSLELSAAAGERRTLAQAGAGNAELDLGRGTYAAKLGLDLPWRRAEARNAYRESLIALDRARRAAEELEDTVKAQIRAAARDWVQARHAVRIQRQAVEVARRRVESVELFLQAGRAQIRDLLEAQEALVSAQNALTSAIVARRLAELALLRDLERLEVDDEGLWKGTLP